MLDLFRTLPGLLADVEGAEAVREAVVFAAWRRIAGEQLAEHAVAVGLANSRLIVAVSNLTWQRQLKDLCGQMVFKLNAALGSPLVTYIELTIDEPAVLRERDKRMSASPDETLLRREAEKELSADLVEAANRISDGQLRRQFLLAAGNCLVRRKRSSL